MSHASYSWLNRIPFPPPHSTPSLLYPPDRSTPCHPQPGVPFGCLAEQRRLTGYEPNDLVGHRHGSCDNTLALRAYAREKQALIRVTTLARTSPQPVHRRKWMKDQIQDLYL